MAETTFQRARSAEHKTQRREAILAAATALAIRNGVRAVSLGDIAAEVGIHKSALLRYFETREQIFLELNGRAWEEWADATVATLGALAAGDDGAVADALADSFASRPLLCDLIPHTALNLERHVSVPAVRAYKFRSLGSVHAVAAALERPLTPLGAEGCREVVSMLSLLAGGYYQISTPPPPLAELYLSEPDLGHSLLDLPGRLRRSARVLIAGARAAA